MINQGDVFDYDFGPVVDERQAGHRPAVVIQTDLLNAVERYTLTMLVPLTTKGRPSSPSHVAIEPSASNGLSQLSFAKCEQIHTVHKSQLGKRRGQLASSDWTRVVRGVKAALDFE
jgi:mRNA-degrading endonuclease toxin of MazEF toxin-antitoxin module